MTKEDVLKIVEDHIDLIAVDAKGIAHAKERAATFLVCQSILSTYSRELKQKKAKLKTTVEAGYAMAIRASEGKNITEKKVNVALDKTYSKYREAFEDLEALEDWVKTHTKIFENAHLMFRQYSRD